MRWNSGPSASVAARALDCPLTQTLVTRAARSRRRSTPSSNPLLENPENGANPGHLVQDVQPNPRALDAEIPGAESVHRLACLTTERKAGVSPSRSEIFRRKSPGISQSLVCRKYHGGMAICLPSTVATAISGLSASAGVFSRRHWPAEQGLQGCLLLLQGFVHGEQIETAIEPGGLQQHIVGL